MNKITLAFFLLSTYCSATFIDTSWEKLPEIYQDIWIQGQAVHSGVRSCSDRYEAIREILHSLPSQFKALDIGASQGYFSFRMAEEFNARCTLIEGGYLNSTQNWKTADLLRSLCEKNSHIENLSLLSMKCKPEDLKELAQLEQFDLALAFSVIHHMRNTNEEPFSKFDEALQAILALAPMVLIENPINTGEHTKYIQNLLLKAGGKVVLTTTRQSLLYEIYLIDQRKGWKTKDPLPNLCFETYQKFNGSYSTLF